MTEKRARNVAPQVLLVLNQSLSGLVCKTNTPASTDKIAVTDVLNSMLMPTVLVKLHVLIHLASKTSFSVAIAIRY